MGALVEAFAEAKQAGRGVIVLDDVDRMVAGNGQHAASAALLGTLRALLREPLRLDAAAVGSPQAPACLVKFCRRQRSSMFTTMSYVTSPWQ